MIRIDQLYGSIQAWDSRASLFLEGSNAIAEMPIPAIDYKNPLNHKENNGYYGALLKAIECGYNSIPLDITKTLQWRKLILDEIKSYKIPLLEEEPDLSSIHEFLEFLNGKLKSNSHCKDSEVVVALADIVYEITSKNIFKPISDRMARLIMNYAATFFKSPIIVFTPAEKDVYLSSLSEKNKLRLLLAEKVREAVIKDGQLMTKVGGRYGTDRYKFDASISNERLLIEWHELIKASKSWENNSASQ